MTWNVDARVPVRFGTVEDADPEDALLVEGAESPSGRAAARFDVAASEHGLGCACCVPRSPVALALNTLFQQRAKGEVPFFRGVVAMTRTAEGDMAIWAALRSDKLTAGRFRMVD